MKCHLSFSFNFDHSHTMKFSHLHNHTQYSLLDGASSIKKLFSKAIKDQMPAVAITDHGNMFGVFDFVKEAKKYKDENGNLKYFQTQV